MNLSSSRQIQLERLATLSSGCYLWYYPQDGSQLSRVILAIYICLLGHLAKIGPIRGKISAQAHTIVKQICFPNGNVLFLSLLSLSKNWMRYWSMGLCGNFTQFGFLGNCARSSTDVNCFGEIFARPHISLCIQFLDRDNNDKNNTSPLGKQICFTRVWGCAEILSRSVPLLNLLPIFRNVKKTTKRLSL